MAKSKVILKFFWQGFVYHFLSPFPLCLAILQYLSCFAFLRARCWMVEPCFIYSGWVNSGFSMQKRTMKLNKGLLTEEPVKPKNKLKIFRFLCDRSFSKRLDKYFIGRRLFWWWIRTLQNTWTLLFNDFKSTVRLCVICNDSRSTYSKFSGKFRSVLRHLGKSLWTLRNFLT